jgi:glycosyltransferase involved in cell wall biosynthesis
VHKVVHMATNHSPFDTRIFLKECRTLADNGYHVTFVVPHDKDEMRDGVQIRAVPLPKTRRERMTKTTWQVFRAALAEQAVIYHFHDPELLPFACLLKLYGKRVVYDMHEYYPEQILSKYWLPRWSRRVVAIVIAALETLTTAIFDAVVVVNHIPRRLPRHKAHPIRNYPILAGWPKPESYIDRPYSVAYVGGISPIRGALEMLKALEHLDSVEVALAGPFQPPSFAEELKRHPEWRRVAYHGLLAPHEVQELLVRSKIGMVTLHPVPNYLIALPVKLFEYMAAGMPVVVSDFPLWREIVEGAGCGLLVDPLKPAEIAQAITWLLEHPKEAEAMGQRGQHAVQTRYNWKAEGQKLCEVYKRLLC